jgi:hypothetical protein
MNCPGSVALINTLALPQSDESEYAKEGTIAHEMAAWCLAHGLDAWEAAGAAWSPGMVEPVQVYLDEVRSLMSPTSTSLFEQRVSSPRHPLFYGTVDAAILDGSVLHVRDFKFGAGVVVEVEGNPQILYYAYGILQRFPAVATVTLGIVQPRAHHPDGAVRVVELQADDVRDWAEVILFPAMDAVQVDASLEPGAWCRFCPAKLVCPMLSGLFGAAAKADTTLVVGFDDAHLDREYDKIAAAKNYITAVEKSMLQRLEAGAKMQFAKLVNKKANRVWREGAMDVLVARLGDKAMTTPELMGPPGIEKVSPAAKKLVLEWAYSPFTGYTVAHALDSRPSVQAPSIQDTFAHVVAPNG